MFLSLIQQNYYTAGRPEIAAFPMEALGFQLTYFEDGAMLNTLLIEENADAAGKPLFLPAKYCTEKGTSVPHAKNCQAESVFFQVEDVSLGAMRTGLFLPKHRKDETI